MGASLTSELLNQPTPEASPPQNFTFSQVNTFPFYLNQLEESSLVTYVQKNFDSYVDPWLGFCLTPALGLRRQTIKSVLSASASRTFRAQSPPTPTLRAPHLQLITQFSNHSMWNPSRPPPFIPFHVCGHWKLSQQSLQCEKHKKFLAILNSGWQPFTKPANISPLLNQPQMTK